MIIIISSPKFLLLNNTCPKYPKTIKRQNPKTLEKVMKYDNPGMTEMRENRGSVFTLDLSCSIIIIIEEITFNRKLTSTHQFKLNTS